MPRIVLLSDTHNCNEQISVPDGDILIHAGDATNRGQVDEIADFNEWFSGFPHKHKIFVAGNHDWLFETRPKYARSLLAKNVVYLQDSAVEISGLKIYGSPWQPRFFDWAFNLNRGGEMAEKWKLIPNEVDILITHGPPFGILDETPRGDFAGCEELRKRVEEIRPQLHVSNCDEDYLPTNLPIVVDL
jgi:Icc-related predicted phosphoesterase